MWQPFLFFSDWGLLVLRFVLGLILVYHGLPKIKSLNQTKENFKNMGLRLASFWAVLVSFLEFFGGLLLIFGLLTQIIALLVFLQFLFIVFFLKRKAKFDEKEFDLLILASALALIVLGGGVYSLDFYFKVWL